MGAKDKSGRRSHRGMGKASKKVVLLDSKHGRAVQSPSSLLPQVHRERLDGTAHAWPMFSVPELRLTPLTTFYTDEGWCRSRGTKDPSV